VEYTEFGSATVDDIVRRLGPRRGYTVVEYFQVPGQRPRPQQRGHPPHPLGRRRLPVRLVRLGRHPLHAHPEAEGGFPAPHLGAERRLHQSRLRQGHREGPARADLSPLVTTRQT